MRPSQEGDDEQPHRRWRDRILVAAVPIAGQVVLDVGCGEGLVAFGALDRGAREIVFSDISDDLLDDCREAARGRGVLDRCRFVNASADDLRPLEPASVDVTTTRAVLIYVDDKESAFREFARVLRPGGRLSIIEPINRFARRSGESWMGYDLAPVADLAAKVRSVYDAIQPPDTDPMLNFDERDLLSLAERAGFFPINLQLEAEVRPSDPRDWDRFSNTAGNPRIPTIAEAVERTLTKAEAVTFTAHLRPLVEDGRGTWRMATAHLWAVKPSD